MKLYSHPISGNCWKASLLLSLLRQPCETVHVDLAAGQHKSADFLALNPLGQLPVLQDGDVALRDSQAILVYLAETLPAAKDYYPADPAVRGQIQSWLSYAAREVAEGPGALRLNRLFKLGREEAPLHARASAVFAFVDSQLAGRSWLVGETPTLADVAVYPYLWLAPDGGFDLSPYAHVAAWMKRLEALPGFLASSRA